MTPNLKAEFTYSWAMGWRFDAPEEALELRDCNDIALEMFKADIHFWEHYGWAHALVMAISPTQISQEECQELSAKLVRCAPLGFIELNPRVLEWAHGDFSKHESLQELVRKTQPEWLERLQENRKKGSAIASP